MAPKVLPVRLGVGPDEFVLRGGFLPAPVVLESVEIVGDKLFANLPKTSNTLSRFLTGERASKRRLANSLTLETLAEMRNDKRQELRAKLLATADPAEPSGPEASLSVFGAAPVAKAGEPTKRRNLSNCSQRERAKLKGQMPKTCVVEFTREGFDPWTVELLLSVSDKHGVSMEVNQPNFQRLFEFVRDDLATGACKRSQHGAGRADRPQPRGHAGAREYRIGKRWRQKILKPRGGLTSSATPGALEPATSTDIVPVEAEQDQPDKKRLAGESRYRVLSRKGTDVPSPPKLVSKKKGKARATVAEMPSHPKPAQASADDDLDIFDHPF